MGPIDRGQIAWRSAAWRSISGLRSACTERHWTLWRPSYESYARDCCILLTAESTLSSVGVADPAASDAECIADQFCYWRLLPAVGPRPIRAARCGCATEPPLAGNRASLPIRVAVAAARAAARSPQKPATEPTGGRAIVQASRTRGTPGAQRNRHGLERPCV